MRAHASENLLEELNGHTESYVEIRCRTWPERSAAVGEAHGNTETTEYRSQECSCARKDGQGVV